MSRIYISTSVDNKQQPELISVLRTRGHLVYDPRHTDGIRTWNTWDYVSGRLRMSTAYHHGLLTPADLERMLADDRLFDDFNRHFNAMSNADTCVLLLPCDESNYIEAGYFAGMGKRVLVMDAGKTAIPNMSLLTFDGYFYDLKKLCEAIDEPVPGVCRICGCTETNACYHPAYGRCWWVAPSLCSHCATTEQGGLGIGQAPETEHCVNDLSIVFKIVNR